MNQLHLKLPSYGITRYYMLNFLHLVDFNNATITVNDGKVHIISRGATINELVADTFADIQSILRQYIGESERIEVPASGNDQKIFSKLRREMGLSSDSSFAEIFRTYGMRLRDNSLEFEQDMNADPIHSAPSIFKPELYSLTRGPFFNGSFASELNGYEAGKYNLGDFMIRLGGFLASRIATINVADASAKPRYRTVLVLPTEGQKISGADFHLRLNKLKTELFPGFNPPEALIMWLSVTLPEDSPDILVVGMEGPVGQAVAKVDMGFNIPLRSYNKRASDFLRDIRNKELANSLKYLIRIAMKDNQSTVSGSLLKLLFRASQQDRRAGDELLLRASKIVVGNVNESTDKATYVKVSNGLLKFATIVVRNRY